VSRSTLGKYILDGHTVVECHDLIEWAKWFEENTRKVDKTMVDDVMISTVFLGLDHSWTNNGPPLLFETMIFGGEHDEYQERYATWDEAVAGHEVAVNLVRSDEQ